MRLWIGLLCCASLGYAADPMPDRIRDSATRAISLLQASQSTWYAKIACHSCHHQFLPAIAFREARARGIPVDETIAHADALKAFAFTDLDAAVQYRDVQETTMDLGFSLVAADATGLQPNLASQALARLVAGRQDPAGNWDDIHQRPPQSYSRFTQTALGLRAIQLYSHPSQKTDVTARVARARAWLLSHTPRDTEERTWQLLGLSWTGGADKAFLAKAAKALAATQLSDGGWNSLDGRASDAYSTAEVLVALHEAGGVPVSNPGWRRGIGYLVRNQMPDGSWHVPSRLHPPAQVSPPYFESGYPYAHDQYLSATAASLAVIAFSQALGPGKPVSTAWSEDLKDIEPWAETVLFGSIADLKALLARGFDPNSATKSGGTTALMMAAPDATKMKLLIDRGANVSALAKSKASALTIAAYYVDSTPAIDLLLAHGADVRASTLSPLRLAAGSANPAVFKPLLAAGDRIDRGLLAAVRIGKVDAARTLLDLGAPVDEADGSGATALDRAVMSNQLELAQVLIQHGANVNYKDASGMTPLLYAASVDFGDSAMIDLLLKSGARAATATSDGLTAVDLARKYNHAHLLPRLSATQ